MVDYAPRGLTQKDLEAKAEEIYRGYGLVFLEKREIAVPTVDLEAIRTILPHKEADEVMKAVEDLQSFLGRIRITAPFMFIDRDQEHEFKNFLEEKFGEWLITDWDRRNQFRVNPISKMCMMTKAAGYDFVKNGYEDIGKILREQSDLMYEAVKGGLDSKYGLPYGGFIRSKGLITLTSFLDFIEDRAVDSLEQLVF